ncbi:MAG: hypothetical protein ABIW50_00290 [Candidatus Limnocylindria bacterium]
MDEPVPIRRAAVGCLLVALAVVVVALLVRPAIFSVAEPRDDSVVTAGTVTEVAAGPILREVILSRSRGWSGERDADSGRVQVTVIVATSTVGGITAVNAASPGREDCPVVPSADRLTDCEGRAWDFGGFPLDTSVPPLERVATDVDGGTILLDMTRPAE